MNSKLLQENGRNECVKLMHVFQECGKLFICLSSH